MTEPSSSAFPRRPRGRRATPPSPAPYHSASSVAGLTDCRVSGAAVLGHLDNRSGKTLSLLGGIGFDAVSLNSQMQAWATMGLIVKADGIAQGAVA